MTSTPNLDAAVERTMGAGETGLQVAAYVDGELAVDRHAGQLWAGGPDVGSGTIFWVASAGKVSTATALHVLVQRGLVAYDQPVATVWPEFGTRGKEGFTVRDALTHRVGLADVPHGATPEQLGDWAWMTGHLAGAAPDADPAAREAYHARTWGHLVGEIVRRADPAGRSFVQLVHEEVHRPLGVEEVWHRVPAELSDRVAVATGDILSGDPVRITVTEDSDFNSDAFRDRVDPSGSWMTARAGARLWAAYAQEGELDGVRLLPPSVVADMLGEREGGRGAGPLAGPRAVVGRGGLWLGAGDPAIAEQLGFRGSRVLWHAGAGGALGFADLDAGLAVMICHNGLFDERPHAEHPFAPLVRAVYADLLGF